MCPPFGPLPAPFIASPAQRPHEWLIIAGVTTPLIVMLAVMRRRLKPAMQPDTRRLVLALVAFGVACQIAALAILMVGQMPWDDAMYAAYFPQLAHVAAVADHRVCYDALDHHFYLAQQAGEFVYAVGMVIAGIAGVSALVLAHRLLRKHEGSAMAGAQPAEQG